MWTFYSVASRKLIANQPVLNAPTKNCTRRNVFFRISSSTITNVWIRHCNQSTLHFWEQTFRRIPVLYVCVWSVFIIVFLYFYSTNITHDFYNHNYLLLFNYYYHVVQTFFQREYLKCKLWYQSVSWTTMIYFAIKRVIVGFKIWNICLTCTFFILRNIMMV